MDLHSYFKSASSSTRVAALVLIVVLVVVVVVVVVVVRLNQIKVLNIALLKGTVPLHQRLQ